MTNTSNTLTATLRTCNCIEPAIPDNLLRKLMELLDPRVKAFNTEPCQHRHEVGIDLLDMSLDTKTRQAEAQ